MGLKSRLLYDITSALTSALKGGVIVSYCRNFFDVNLIMDSLLRTLQEVLGLESWEIQMKLYKMICIIPDHGLDTKDLA
jgi:hypothetical protein